MASGYAMESDTAEMMDVHSEIDSLKSRTHKVWAEAKERLSNAEEQVARRRAEFNAIDEFYQPMVGPQKSSGSMDIREVRI